MMAPSNDIHIVFGLELGLIKLTYAPFDGWLSLLDKNVFDSVDLGGFTGCLTVNLRTLEVKPFPLPSVESYPRHSRLLLERTAAHLARRLG